MWLKKEKKLKWIILICLIVGLTGCAISKFPGSDPQDPYEHLNRKIFAFNMALDRAFFRPVAKVYDKLLPWQLKKGVRNFFSNVGDVTSAANEILQFNFPQCIADLARVAINTTIGLGGLFDVATKLGIEKDKEDFGLTLARWGAKDTPYLVLPFLGPYTLRDAVGVPIDYFFLSIWPYLKSDRLVYSLEAAYLVQYRASLLVGDDIIDQAFDPYIFVRDAYLQRRAYLIKENEEERVVKYIDEQGVARRQRRSIPPQSVLSN